MEGAKVMISAPRGLPLLAGAMAGVAGGSEQKQPGHWVLGLRGTRVDARFADSWLVMTSPIAAACAPAQLLAWNALLPPWVNFAFAANGEPQIRAEIPLDEESGIAALVREAWVGFEAAHAILLGGEAPAGLPDREASQEDLKRLCEESGWSALPRGANAVAVELECRGAFIQATLAACNHGLRAAVELPAVDDPGGEAAEAAGLFLLAAAAEFRMVRPAMEIVAGKAAARFEIVFSPAPAPAQLAHAFSALSVACQHSAEEVKALRNPDVAGEFLALRGRSKTRAQTTTTN
jgi:hypothetical protein